MKIKNIKRDDKNYSVYVVKFEPNWLEKKIGVKEKTKQYKSTGRIYVFGGGNVYINKKGNSLGNGHWIGEAIDKWRRAAW
jgi:hypothetical protein